MTEWNIYSDYVPYKTAKIYFVGDTHVGHKGFDVDTFYAHMKQIGRERKSRIVLMGDLIEIAVKPKMTREQTLNTRDQLDFFIDLLQPAKKKVSAVLSGNHERRIETVDYLRDALMPELKKAVYLGYEGYFDIATRNRLVRTYLHHGYGGSQTPQYFIKNRLMKAGIGNIVDVIAVGHIHKRDIQKYLTLKREGNKITTKTLYGLRTGTYLKNAEYARIHGYEPTDVGCVYMKIQQEGLTLGYT